MIYFIILLVFTLIASSRGNNVWFQSVKDANFFASSVDAEKTPAQQTAPQYPANFAPQQATQGVPFDLQGYPPRQFQTTPSDQSTPQMSSPQKSFLQIASPQTSIPQV
jgi:hypothetical protein